MSNKRSNSFRQAILQGNRRLCSKALLEEKGLNLSQRLIRHVAYETLPREIDRKWYYDSYTCCPPPWFMITITLLEARTRVGQGRPASAQPGQEGVREREGQGSVFSAKRAMAEGGASGSCHGKSSPNTGQAVLSSLLDPKDIPKILTSGNSHCSKIPMGHPT